MSDAMIQMAPGSRREDETLLRWRHEWGDATDGCDYETWLERRLLYSEDRLGGFEARESGLHSRIYELEKERSTLTHLIGGAQIRIDQLESSVMSLRAIIDAKLHRRKCYTCGHVGYYAAGVVPYCLCDKCKSQDTRKVKP